MFSLGNAMSGAPIWSGTTKFPNPPTASGTTPRKTVHRGIALWLAVGSVPMAIAGVWLIEILQHSYGEDEVNKVVLGMVGSALLVVGVATLIRALFLRDVIPERYAMHLYRRHIVAA